MSTGGASLTAMRPNSSAQAAQAAAAYPATAPGAGSEPCPRCAATMIWTKASWHCLACRYKEGCC
jgi:hypothetical protein